MAAFGPPKVYGPGRTASGYREYDQSVIDRLTFIRAGQGVGLTLNELREVLVARIWGQLSFEEIAGLCHISAATAWRRYQAALDALRSRLEVGCER